MSGCDARQEALGRISGERTGGRVDDRSPDQVAERAAEGRLRVINTLSLRRVVIGGREIYPLLPTDLADDEWWIPNLNHDCTPARWEQVYERLAGEVTAVWQQRGLGAEPSAWFVRWTTGVRRPNLVAEIEKVQLRGLAAVQETFPQERLYTRTDVLVLAGRLLARLVDADQAKSLRSWFGQQKQTEGFWHHGLLFLGRSRFGRLARDVPYLLWVLDELTRLSLIRTRLPVQKLVSLRRLGDGLGWDLGPIVAMLDTAERVGCSWRALFLFLLQRQVDEARRRGWRDARLDLDAAGRALSLVTDQDLRTLPRAGTEEWKVEVMLALGLPGGCQVPDRVRFGLDTRGLEQAGRRLIRLSEHGQAVYQDDRGKVHSEGVACPVLPAIRDWGKGLVLWCDAASASYLLSHWWAPPELCPWAWYSVWGDGAYDAQGRPVRGVDRFHQPVRWLEQAVAGGG
jgi:hypothetical protein